MTLHILPISRPRLLEPLFAFQAHSHLVETTAQEVRAKVRFVPLRARKRGPRRERMRRVEVSHSSSDFSLHHLPHFSTRSRPLVRLVSSASFGKSNASRNPSRLSFHRLDSTSCISISHPLLPASVQPALPFPFLSSPTPIISTTHPSSLLQALNPQTLRSPPQPCSPDPSSPELFPPPPRPSLDPVNDSLRPQEVDNPSPLHLRTSLMRTNRSLWVC